MDGKINYDECLRNIYDKDATEEEKILIDGYFGMKNLGNDMSSYCQQKDIVKLIKKYRPEYS